MKRFLFFALIAASLSLAVSAQSGRRIAAPKPTPTPSESSNADNTGYSESKPLPKRAITALPTLRSIPSADTKPSTDQSKKDQPEVLSDSEDEVVRVETNLVTIPVSVFDRNGLYIPDLGKDNFKIFEDGKEQQIEYFATSENPFTVAILLDTSPSTEFKIEEIQDAAIAFVDQLQPQDSVMVVEFNRGVRLLTEPTLDRQKIRSAIRRISFGGGTSLYDAVDESLRKHLSRVTGRKAIVLFTDGVDTTSRASYDRSLNEAEEADSTIFPIYYNTYFENRQRNGGGGGMGSPFPPMGGQNRGLSSQEYALGRQYLKDLADSTGGRVFNAENTAGGLTRTFESIAEELRRQYSIGYIPQETGQPGQRKQIKVRVNRPNLIIRARDSYIVGQKKSGE
ncbi:MAG: VWA domain-containing protein [Acidobacteria bacterium]|nr:VWA domain-containing protein [Acidobacteriota bacterium]